MAVIPERHILYDHIANVAIRNKQVDTGPWSDHDFKCFVQLVERLKFQAKDPVVNEEAFWQYFAAELKQRSGVSRPGAECAKMVRIFILTMIHCLFKTANVSVIYYDE